MRRSLLTLLAVLACRPAGAQQALPDAPLPQRFTAAAGLGMRYRQQSNGTVVLDALASFTLDYRTPVPRLHTTGTLGYGLNSNALTLAVGANYRLFGW